MYDGPLLLPEIAFLAGAGAAGAALGAAGASLGLAVGCFFIVALLVPTLSGGNGSLPRRSAVAAAAVAGTASVCLALIGPGTATVYQWTLVTALLLSFAAALVGLDAALESAGFHSILAEAITVAIGLVWLTWPIWLSPWIAAGGWTWGVEHLILVHPPLVANGILTFTPPWTEQSIAYRLTVLDQDIAVQLPGNPWICIGFHVIIGTALAAVGYFMPSINRGAKILAANARDMGPM